MKLLVSISLLSLLSPLSLASPFVSNARDNSHINPDSENKSPSCDCKGTKPSSDVKTARQFICRDSRLGPTTLPRRLPLSGLINSYDRFGGLAPGQFLGKWTDSSGNYVYPPQNGFSLDADGNGINGTMTLNVGTLLDRFGSEYGM
jgi:hypothetical protein